MYIFDYLKVFYMSDITPAWGCEQF